jgi:hypothetical protein
MKYRITVPVKCVSGYQIFDVEAKDEDEAMELFNGGEGEFVDEELEVTDLDKANAEVEPIK